VQAFVTNSDVNVTDGNVRIEALKDVTVSSDTKATLLSGTPDSELALTIDVSLGGTSSVNAILGVVSAFIDGGSVTTVGTGDIELSATDTSSINATA
jgi:hypothetical protein